MRITTTIMILPVLTIGYPYRLLGDWKVSSYDLHSKRAVNARVHIYPQTVQINLKQDLLGGILTCQKELSGTYSWFSDVDTQQQKMHVAIQLEVHTIDSFLGVEMRVQKEKTTIRGRMLVTILDCTTDVVVLSTENYIRDCSQKKSQEFLLTRIHPSFVDPSVTPINLLLIGQFVGFLVYHLYDGILTVLRSLL